MAASSSKLLRKRDNNIASVSFSELLFDLIYVFAVTQLSHYLLHHLNWTGLIQQMILWFAVWLAWQHTTWVTNWFNPNAKLIRLLLFCIMLVGLVMAAAIPEAFTGRGSIFALSYIAIQLGRTLVIIFILGNRHHLSANFKRILGWFCISSIFWIAGIFYGGYTRMVLWAIAVLCDYISPMVGFILPFLGRSNSSKEWTVEGHHLIERCQLFVIIAFGEVILSTGASLSEIEIWNPDIVVSSVTSFIGSLAMWWIYFDTSSEAGEQKIMETRNPGLLGLKYNAVHVVLVGAIIICAVGDELIISNPQEHLSTESVFVIIIGPIIYLAANMIYKWITCNVLPLSHILAIGILVILIPLSHYINLMMMNIMVTTIFIFIIIFEFINPEKAGKI